MAIGDDLISPTIGVGGRKERDSSTGGGWGGPIGGERIGPTIGVHVKPPAQTEAQPVDHNAEEASPTTSEGSSWFGPVGHKSKPKGESKPAKEKSKNEDPGPLSVVGAYAVIATRKFLEGRKPTTPQAPPPEPYFGADPEAVRASKQAAEERIKQQIVDSFATTPLSEVGKSEALADARSYMEHAVPVNRWKEEAQRLYDEAKAEASAVESKRRAITQARKELRDEIGRVQMGNVTSTRDWNLENLKTEPGVVGSVIEELKGRVMAAAAHVGHDRADDIVEIHPDGLVIKNPSERRPDRKIPWQALEQRFEIDVPPSGWADGINDALGERRQAPLYPGGIGRLKITDAQQRQVEVDVPVIDPRGFRARIDAMAKMYKTAIQPLPGLSRVPLMSDFIPVPRSLAENDQGVGLGQEVPFGEGDVIDGEFTVFVEGEELD